MLTCVASAAPAFTAKVPEEPEKVIYLHWYITKTEEGILDLLQQRNMGWTPLQPADEQHKAEVAGEILTCLHMYAHVCLLSVCASEESLQGESEGEIFVIYHSHLSCTDK